MYIVQTEMYLQAIQGMITDIRNAVRQELFAWSRNQDDITGQRIIAERPETILPQDPTLARGSVPDSARSIATAHGSANDFIGSYPLRGTDIPQGSIHSTAATHGSGDSSIESSLSIAQAGSNTSIETTSSTESGTTNSYK